MNNTVFVKFNKRDKDQLTRIEDKLDELNKALSKLEHKNSFPVVTELEVTGKHPSDCKCFYCMV